MKRLEASQTVRGTMNRKYEATTPRNPKFFCLGSDRLPLSGIIDVPPGTRVFSNEIHKSGGH